MMTTLGFYFNYGLAVSLVLMEGEDDWHVTSPVELKYLTCLNEGNVLCQTLPSVPGLISTDIMTP